MPRPLLIPPNPTSSALSLSKGRSSLCVKNKVRDFDKLSPNGIIVPLPIVAIIGRPNVGKSTLFNRLVGKRLALVDDQPGVTRDRREGEANLLGLEFRVMDTAGYEDKDV